VAVYDFFSISPLAEEKAGAGAAYTQEFVDGRDLWSVCREVGSSERELLFEQIFQALAYLHALNVVHCDLKPENVMVEEKGGLRARLLDFGIARQGQSGPSGIRGSKSYIAPEVLAGGEVTPEADLYALGVMMAEAWSGQTPTPEELAGELALESVRRAYLLDKGVPESWCPVVVALLAQDPSCRPSSIASAAELWSSGLGRPVILQTAASRTSMLRAGPVVGRDVELDQAIHRLESAQSVAFTGPAGVGKTTLARALMRQLQEKGINVEWFSGGQTTSTVRTLGECLGRLLGCEIHWGTEETLDGEGEDPNLGSRAKALSTRFTAWLDRECERLIGGLPSGPSKAVVLFLDDLQAASPLVQHLAKRLYTGSLASKHRVQVVMTNGAGLEDVITLGPLSRSAAQALVGTRLGESAASARLGAVLAAASGGNPLMIENLLALLVDREELSYQGGRWVLVVEPADIRLPSTAMEAMTERVSLLSRACQEHLAAIAWIRFPTKPEEITAVLGVRCETLILLELDAAGLLWRGTDGRISIGHSAVMAACSDWSPQEGRGKAQKRLLELGSLSPLADAWHRGGSEGCRRAIIVTESAWTKGDMGEAARAVRVALHCDSTSKVALLKGARIANLTGPREWQVQCLEDFLGVPGLGEEERLSTEADLFWALTRIGDTQRAEKVGNALLEHARAAGQDSVYLDALIHMANTQIQRGDYGQGRASLLEALERAEGTSFTARIVNNLGNVEMYEGNLDEALKRYTEAYELKRAEGDPIGTRIALGNMGLMCFELGRYPEAMENFARSRKAAVETGHRRGEAWSLLGLAVLGLKAGALAYAQRRATLAVELAEALGDRVIAWDAMGTLVEIALVRGDREGALQRSKLSMDTFQDVDSPYNLAGAKSVRAMAIQDSDPEHARCLASEVLADSSIKDLTIRAHAAKVVCEVAMVAGDLDEVARTIRGVMTPDAWKMPIRALLSFESAARLVGDAALTQTIHAASHQALKAGASWPVSPWDDELDELVEHDGPSLGSFEKQDAVIELRRRLERRETMHMGVTKNVEWDSDWPARLANTSDEDLGACVALYLREAVETSGAERGFILAADGSLLASADADGEEVASAEAKVPDGVVAIVADSAASYRADSSSGQKGTLCAVPALVAGQLSGVLILQNRFVSDAFPEVQTGGSGDHVLGLILRLRSLSLQLASSRTQASHNETQRRKEQSRSTEEILRLRKELENTREMLSPENSYSEIIFRSSAMKKMLRRLDRVVGSSLPVYVHGESGSGKELVARAIHSHGNRKDGPFVAQNCSAIPTTLFESEFFGHEKGAFTGADRASEGLFRRASGGTLFLDEIGDLPLDLQAKLLRVLETGEVRAVGGRKDHSVDVRIICATHRDLAKQVEEKRFREDLFYRLNVVRVDVPPLRERPDDIPLLVAHFMEVHRGQGASLPELEKGVMKALISYRWPGNVRQLENEVIRAALLSDGTIGVDDLSPEILKPWQPAPEDFASESGTVESLGEGTLKERVDRLEFRVLKGSLKKYGGNKSKVARELGLSRAGLNMKLKRLELWEQESE